MLSSHLRRRSALRSFSLACSATLLASAAAAQSPVLLAAAAEAPAFSSSLPEAPEPVAVAPSGNGFSGQAGALSTAPVASQYAMVIQPGQTAPKISKRTEVIAGIRDSFTPAAMIGWVASETYSFATNGSPNYPQTGKGYAQGLGAAAARATSENIFTEAILDPVLHEDARYYRMGNKRNFVVRLVYAGTRSIITRTDGGRQTINLAGLGGNLAGSALTPVYYPPLNQSGTEVLKTFGGSVGGSALGYVVEEFLPDIFHRHQ